MSHFRLLRDPASYVAHDWDLLADSSARKHWLDHFVQHFEVMLSHAATQYGRTAGKSVPAARQQFTAAIDALRKKPSSLPSGKLDIYELCRLRDATLRSCGLADPFKAVKDRENASAAALYPAAVRRLHAMTGRER